jgi:ribosome assembly protein RRB1
MAKRPADSEQEVEAIKNGDRPMEAGVDGRPDEEREAEEREST